MKYLGLEKYLPENTCDLIERWMSECPCKIIISRNRKTKLGDFKFIRNQVLSVSVNYSENRDLMFFVLTHEIAHVLVFSRYKNKVLPHGNEWKSTYRNLLLESISFYKTDLQNTLLDFAQNPKASFYAYPALARYFNQEEIAGTDFCYLENINPNDFFEYQSIKFQMRYKRRTRYLCINLSNKKEYLFSALAKVHPIK